MTRSALHVLAASGSRPATQLARRCSHTHSRAPLSFLAMSHDQVSSPCIPGLAYASLTSRLSHRLHIPSPPRTPARPAHHHIRPPLYIRPYTYWCISFTPRPITSSKSNMPTVDEPKLQPPMAVANPARLQSGQPGPAAIVNEQPVSETGPPILFLKSNNSHTIRRVNPVLPWTTISICAAAVSIWAVPVAMAAATIGAAEKK